MRQITAGCHPGSFVALLSAERNAVNADKHWRTRVIYYTSIKRVPILQQQQRRLSLSQGCVCILLPSMKSLQLLAVVEFTCSLILLAPAGKIWTDIFFYLLKETEVRFDFISPFIHPPINLLKLKWQWFSPKQLTAFVSFPFYIKHWSNQQTKHCLVFCQNDQGSLSGLPHSVFFWGRKKDHIL